MSATCERCGHTWHITTDDLINDLATCPRCNPPRKSFHELLDDIGIWLDYSDSYWRYPAWWALIILVMFCIANVGIVFVLTIGWIWGWL